MAEQDMREKKRLDDVFDSRVRATVNEELNKRLATLLTQLETIIVREKHSNMEIIDEELNRSYEQISENFRHLSMQITSLDMECGSLTKTLLDKGIVTGEELGEKYQELDRKVKDAVNQTRELLKQKIAEAKGQVEAEQPVMPEAPQLSQ